MDKMKSGRTLREAREAFEKRMVREAMKRCKGNISKTAEELGVSRPTLYEMIERFGIRKKYPVLMKREDEERVEIDRGEGKEDESSPKLFH
jgi:hypothetical protein